MPGFDGTGPMGLGPMTGGARGFCAAPAPSPNQSGRGRGRGWRNCYRATGLPGWARADYQYPYAPEITPQQETNMLKQQAELLKTQLEGLQSRIDILEKVKSSKEKE